MLKYIMGLLVILVVALGISTYTLIGDVATAKGELANMTEVANSNAKALVYYKESCAITINTITSTQKAIDTLNEARGDDLSGLAAIPQITLPETHVNGSKPTTAPSKVADDLRLSPDLMRLLDNAYCSGAKGDNYCTTR